MRKSNEDHMITYKIMLLGPTYSGKTCIMFRLKEDKFNPNYNWYTQGKSKLYNSTKEWISCTLICLIIR